MHIFSFSSQTFCEVFSMDKNESLPLGFTFALAQDASAMQNYCRLPDCEEYLKTAYTAFRYSLSIILLWQVSVCRVVKQPALIRKA